MANITAAEVNKLRQQTGAGMMDCKKALVESDGDMEKAIEILRKKGQKVASSRADREANEGVVLAKVNTGATKAAIIMLNCETDFVAKNQEIIDFTRNMLDLGLEKNCANLAELKAADMNGRSVEANLTDLIGKTGEKLILAHFDMISGAKTFAYIHPGNRVASIAALNKAEVNDIDQAGKDVVMQIAAMAPVAISKDDVAPAIIEKEIEIGKDQARQEGKPEELVEKIALGKLNKFYKESTLLNQEFIKESKKTVAQMLADYDKDLTVVAFKRFALGQ
ncbi:MAG: translation elongation factor Ts [Bacteroidales bacterium]|jgi:elongation factor Ts|nr:translation elongation factor Ts [Bacteroidales bacterium]NLM92296.1 elongation factor Ts [Bacteroidales bacterium]